MGCFDDFDLASIWKDSDYSKKEYVSAPVTDIAIASVEKRLGYKLPAAYIELMRNQNGGLLARNAFPTSTPTTWADDHVGVNGIYGIGDSKSSSLCGGLGSQFKIDEWEYPPIGIYFASCPSAGHDMIAMDYRRCGPSGEPAIVHVDQEIDYRITPLADTFEQFVRGLVDEDMFD
jgi:hypothetical protein